MDNRGVDLALQGVMIHHLLQDRQRYRCCAVFTVQRARDERV